MNLEAEDRGAIEPFAAALRQRWQAQWERHTPLADVMDVLDRAEALDEGSVPPGLREGLAQLEPVVPLTSARDSGTDRAVLAPMTSALRDALREQLAQRSLAGIPDPPGRTQVGPQAKVELRWVWTAALAVAAAVVLVLLGVRGLSVSEDASNVRSQAERTRAQGGSDNPHQARTWKARAPDEGTDDPRARDSDAVVPPDDTVDKHIEPIEETPVPQRQTPRSRPRRSPKDLYAELEARAQAAWERGDLAEAERLFREIIRRAGRGRHAELAYGDLFALVRQRRGVSGQSEIWREYLQRFPRGRFADDVRAGLCRRASVEQRAQCWSSYLERHPSGAHAAEARRNEATR